MKKFACFFLVFVLIFSFLPVSNVQAASTPDFNTLVSSHQSFTFNNRFNTFQYTFNYNGSGNWSFFNNGVSYLDNEAITYAKMAYDSSADLSSTKFVDTILKNSGVVISPAVNAFSSIADVLFPSNTDVVPVSVDENTGDVTVSADGISDLKDYINEQIQDMYGITFYPASSSVIMPNSMLGNILGANFLDATQFINVHDFVFSNPAFNSSTSTNNLDMYGFDLSDFKFIVKSSYYFYLYDNDYKQLSCISRFLFFNSVFRGITDNLSSFSFSSMILSKSPAFFTFSNVSSAQAYYETPFGFFGSKFGELQDAITLGSNDIVDNMQSIYDQIKESGDFSAGNVDSILSKIDEVTDNQDEQTDKLDSIISLLKAQNVILGAMLATDVVDTFFDDWNTDTLLDSVSGSFNNLANVSKNKFPFCVPWDIYLIYSFLAAEPVAPRFEFNLNLPTFGVNETIVLDLANFQKLSDFSRVFSSIVFLLALLALTRKMFGAIQNLD